MRRPYVVYFDGACGRCNWAVRVMRWLDWFERCEFQDFVKLGHWQKVLAGVGDRPLDRWPVRFTVDAPNGRYVDFEAYRRLAWVLPLGWFLLPLLYAPGVAWCGRRVYAWLSDRSLRRGCSRE